VTRRRKVIRFIGTGPLGSARAFAGVGGWACVIPVAIAAFGVAGCGGGGATSCEYRASPAMTGKFSFSVTLPDSTVQSCATLPASDAGLAGPSSLSGQVSGWIKEVDARAFSLDSCGTGTGCSPEVYGFTLDAPGLSATLSLGRQVTVSWQVSSIVGRACLQELVVNDGLPSDVASGMWPPLWLAGADSTLQPSMPVPFSVAPRALFCNPNPTGTHACGGTLPPDDYALVFTPATGEQPLSLAAGNTGTLAVTTALGLQHLTVHNLRSYQTANCDDYWNWAWWVAGQADATGQPE
jgi:hypothetical protein